MRPVLVALASLLTFLAGCTGDPGGGPEAQAIVDDSEFEDYQATSTTGVIRGVVIDDAVRPLAGAEIRLNLGDGARNATSTDSGAFGFADLEPGTYFMEVSKPGYGSVQHSAEVVAGVDEPELLKVVLTIDPDAQPYFSVVNWNGFIECSFRVAVPGVTSLGVNACNGVGNQDVNFPLAPMDAIPDLVQGELVWDSTQPVGSGLSFVVGPPSCVDIKYARADGESPLVIKLDTPTLLNESAEALDDGFVPEDGICFRAFSYVASESAGTLGLVTSQQFDAYFHVFYNMLPPDGWQFSVDGNPPLP